MPAVRIGTDCSGLDAPVFAVKTTRFVASAGLDVVHAWACDNDKESKQFIMMNHKPLKFHDDMTADRKLAAVDVYCVGLPCQPFSGLGQMNGMADKRMSTYKGFLKVLQSGRAKAFVLENVVRLESSNNGKTMKRILRDCKSAGYNCSVRKYDSLDFGLPQSRQRLFIVGVQKRYGTVTLPGAPQLPVPRLSSFMDKDCGTAADRPRKAQKHARRMLRKSIKGLKNLGKKPNVELWCVDIDSSEQFANAKQERSLCLTRSRPRGFWLSSLRRRMRPKEMLKIHGFPVEDITLLQSSLAMGRLAGNTMSVPVVSHVLDAVLPLVHKGN
eukprot:TRINITY_DN30418_c0_g1_i1.p1 TRINITY_DN30418_c0_g1~~TRINITY_DN30418_c0_g1_i1.p1  ORF type:complete len:327 (-),score=46.28 TRINITY_DN30418_c0_g1_i1:35-1015(-)